MSNKNATKPAYPIMNEDGNTGGRQGLTKREQIAAMCLQGLLSRVGERVHPNGDSPVYATWAVNCADALLRELEDPE